MKNDIVLMNVLDGVATITLNRPDTHNAFDEHMIAALSGKLDALHVEKDVRAVILSGNGKSFSAGADLNWMKRAANFSEEQNKADALALAEMLHKLYTLPVVTIACVQGAAMGGGMGLVSCCDFVIADENALFALSEVKLGLIPATIAPYVLRAIGERQARRYFQSGERINAAQACEIGLAHEIAGGPEDMADKLESFIKGILVNGPEAMKAAKKLCLDLAGKPLTPSLMEDTASRIAHTRAGAEAKEGLSAFLEKRKATWV
ncbi:MAG: enoyl-CoA hydratase/isomerase family protein [Micavibrio aeruginosavorus]|uniref:Enoyl-CoA hydratase/isomerase family protein n=1 Tax=Micavibrio aeruginosavorus TaxID=349221 RepID=A0A7T5R4A3_9BACT|nr:MAG: enoyl-CoA hydratase/isomerase family protein [Micavibrio aeruginosavorus]